MKIKKISKTGKKAFTYDIEVPDVHNYILSNGLVTHNSSLASETTNGVYPIRDEFLVKTTETMAMVYVVPEYTKYKDDYQVAWEIDTMDLIKDYAIMQKWTDQAISADEYQKVQGSATVKSSDIIKRFLARAKYGVKTRYYLNSLTAKGIDLNASEESSNEPVEQTTEVGCGSGGCTL